MGHHSRPCGSLCILGRTTTPSATAAIASRPSVREPGEKLGPTARMPTKADAQSTTVMTTAATPSLLIGGAAWPGGGGEAGVGAFRGAAPPPAGAPSLPGGAPSLPAGAAAGFAGPDDPLWGSAGWL